MPEGDDTGAAGGKTFTQAEVDAIVRDRLKREREKYADYDDLKARAGEADKSKTALDQLLEKVSGLEERATKAERQALRADVAQAKGLTPAQAKRLQGATREELEADADELLAMFKPADKDGKSADGGSDGGKDGESGKGGAGDTTTTASTKDDGIDTRPAESKERQYPASARPKEKLTTGAVPATGGEKAPADVAKAILADGF